MDIEQLIKDKMRDIVSLFVIKDYETLKKRYLPEENEIGDFIRALNEYLEFGEHEGIVSMPPDEEFEKVDIVEITKPTKALREFSIIFDLWIDGAKSDLTLDCDAEYYGGENLKVYLYDLHVL